ncbi:MAG: hypothetical protein LC630_06760 [Bacteroidales bacterium]|nr:hypothetical protein [Bacteroidales bacterium]
MNTIYIANIIFYSLEAGIGALFSINSLKTDEVHRRPGRLRREGDPSAGGDPIIRDGFIFFGSC